MTTQPLAAYLTQPRSRIPQHVQAEALTMIEQGIPDDLVTRHVFAATTRARIEAARTART
jgi:hypothetical protein